MKPTGWFHVAWSDQIPSGVAVPLRYFGSDLVAFRNQDGQVALLDGHCRHQGAHLGYGGSVSENCVVCPYHGWEWDQSGANTRIPYEDRPSRARLRKWDVVEKHGLVFAWHDPAGGPPRDGWELPDVFADFPQLVENEADYHRCYPNSVVDKPAEAVHPQLLQENVADSLHFQYVHNADNPHMETFDADGALWRVSMAFVSNRTKEVSLRAHTISAGIGTIFALFHAKTSYRVIITATPVDDETSDLRVSYFLPRDPESPNAFTANQQVFVDFTDTTFEQDAKIWRHQVFVQRPVFAPQDVAAYTALRHWCEQFYEFEPTPGPTPVVTEYLT